MRIYIVVEQWPHREVACFLTLEDAQAFLRVAPLALPLVISREKS
jgi:hypothetical protein